MSDPRALLVLPGAGATRDHPSLLAIEAAVTSVVVVRRHFAYQDGGRSFPPPAATLVDELNDLVASTCDELSIAPTELILGGRSMGGRVASMWAAENPESAPAALVLVSYPLHPPGKPKALRTEHFGRLTPPTLFVSGTRDALGSRHRLRRATAAIPGPVTHRWVDGARHDLRGREDYVAQRVAAFLDSLIVPTG